MPSSPKDLGVYKPLVGFDKKSLTVIACEMESNYHDCSGAIPTSVALGTYKDVR